LSASCPVSELTVSELVCQRDVCLPPISPTCWWRTSWEAGSLFL